MKLKVSIIGCLAALLAVSAGAAEKRKSIHDELTGQGYGMAGCGLGSIAFGDKPGMIQIVAATVNGTFGSQTFGISTGTSNCTPNGGASASAFIYANREALEKDIARGNGETITSLSQVMGCGSTDLLGAKLQGNFKSIFPSQEVSNEAVVNSILNNVRQDATLAATCATIG
jgi:hypothetical protein